MHSSLVPWLSPRANESWAGPGNEATPIHMQTGRDREVGHSRVRLGTTPPTGPAPAGLDWCGHCVRVSVKKLGARVWGHALPG